MVWIEKNGPIHKMLAPKMMNPSEVAGNVEEEEKESEHTVEVEDSVHTIRNWKQLT